MSFNYFAELLDPGAWAFSLGLTLFALPLLIVAGAVGISFFVALSGRTGRTGRIGRIGRTGGMVFADKLSKQLAEFGMMLLGAWLLLVLARFGLWAASWWPAGEVGRDFYPLFFDIPGHLALLSTLTSIALVRLWRRNKRATWAHLTLGAISALLWSATLAAFVAGALWRLDNVAGATKLGADGVWAAVTDPLAWLAWLAWGQLLFLALAAGAGCGLLYLLARRSKEDYGRDYYCWSVKHCAWWAVLAGIVHAGWIKAVFLVVFWWHGALAHAERTERTDLAGADWISDTVHALAGHEAMPALVVALSLGLAACLCLVPVLRTQTPLRMKGWMLLHAGLLLLSVIAVCRVYSALFYT